MKLAKNRQYTVRLMAPFNMRCVTCGEYIYKGKKFNARKEDVENEDYLGIRIYRFYIKCTRCLQEISFKTDPRNTDYEIEAGATRNFMALKLAEEQAIKEEEELREEEANNPMKLLENRTQQSRNEIELLESLEELKDLNRRQQAVDYDSMLSQYDNTETERQKEERLAKLDEEYIKTIKFKTPNIPTGSKRVIAEEIIEVPDIKIKKEEKTEDTKPVIAPVPSKKVKENISVGILGRSQKLSLDNLIKRRNPVSNSATSTVTTSNVISNAQAPTTKSLGSLAMLGDYSDSDNSE